MLSRQTVSRQNFIQAKCCLSELELGEFVLGESEPGEFVLGKMLQSHT